MDPYRCDWIESKAKTFKQYVHHRQKKRHGQCGHGKQAQTKYECRQKLIQHVANSQTVSLKPNLYFIQHIDTIGQS